MALNLLKAGFQVSVFNRTASKAAPVVEAGASTCTSIAELTARCEAVVIVVSDDDAVRAVVQGDDGILAAAAPGLLVIDSSTVHPDTSNAMATALGRKQVTYLDAPVTGSRPQAEQGKLFFLVGGPEAGYRAAVPLLEAMGRKHLHLGPTGLGSCAKLANNMLGFIHMAALSEALSMGKRSGLDPKLLHEVISHSGGRSAVSDGKGPKMIAGDWAPDFALSLAHKDLSLARDLAEQLGLPAPVLVIAKEVFLMARERFGGDGDACSVYRWYEQGVDETPKRGHTT